MVTDDVKKEFQAALAKCPPETLVAAQQFIDGSERMFHEDALLLDAATAVRAKIDFIIDTYELEKTRWKSKEFFYASESLKFELEQLADLVKFVQSRFPQNDPDLLQTAQNIVAFAAQHPTPSVLSLTKEEYARCLKRVVEAANSVPHSDSKYLAALKANGLRLSKEKVADWCHTALKPIDAKSYDEGLYVVPA